MGLGVVSFYTINCRKVEGDKLQFFDRGDTDVYNFYIGPKFPQNGGFLVSNSAYLKEKFLRLQFTGREGAVCCVLALLCV